MIQTEQRIQKSALKAIIAPLNRQPYLFLFFLALLIRLLVALLAVKQPGFVDAYYYYQAAENWQNGQGFVIKTVWNYQITSYNPAQPPPTGDLTHQAFDYWNPLASWLIAASFKIFGVSPFTASLPFMLCAAALPPLAFYLGRLVWGTNQRRYSWLMALITLVPGRYFLFWNAPENFSSFALIGLLCLITIHLGLTRDDRWLLAAGALVGLAYLARSDGAFYGLTMVLSFLWIRFRPMVSFQCWKPRWIMLAAGAGVALLVISPWLWRNYSVLGSIVPPASNKVIWMRDYNELFSHSLTLDVRYYFEWGLNNILGAKLNALWLNFIIFSVQGLFLLAPMFVLGFVVMARQKTDSPLIPFYIHITLSYFLFSLIFTEIGVHGTVFHAAGALLPYQAALALGSCDWLSQKIRQRGKKRRFYQLALSLALLFLVLNGITTTLFAIQVASNWDNDLKYAQTVNEWFELNNLQENVIIIGEPLSYYYATGRPAISLASDGVAANLEAARRFGAKYLVLGFATVQKKSSRRRRRLTLW